MTRSTWTLAFLFLALFAPARAADPAFADPHIRSTEPELLEALAQGVRVSPTLRDLVDRLETSDVVVYLTFDRSLSPQLAGHLSLITAAPGRRYVRVAIDRRNLGCQRIAILGHELHHAIEIAESPAVVDEASLSALYRRIGFRSAGASVDCFDSIGAILAGHTVRKEALARYTEFTQGGNEF
jgi:hypothetical protein